MVLLHELKNYPSNELEFFVKGSQIISKCRQILKWVYCLQFYVEDQWEKSKLDLFLFQKQCLEEACEEAHAVLEKPLAPYIDPNCESSVFYKHRSNVITHTETLEQNYKNFLDMIDN